MFFALGLNCDPVFLEINPHLPVLYDIMLTDIISAPEHVPWRGVRIPRRVS